jgi:hypothetical protein
VNVKDCAVNISRQTPGIRPCALEMIGLRGRPFALSVGAIVMSAAELGVAVNIRSRWYNPGVVLEVY